KDREPLLLLRKSAEASEPAKWFEKGAVNSPALIQAQAIDVDLDGWTDIVGLSAKRLPVLLHNQGGKLVQVKEALGLDAAWPKDVVAVAMADLGGKGRADLLVWSEASGLE